MTNANTVHHAKRFMCATAPASGLTTLSGKRDYGYKGEPNEPKEKQRVRLTEINFAGASFRPRCDEIHRWHPAQRVPKAKVRPVAAEFFRPSTH